MNKSKIPMAISKVQNKQIIKEKNSISYRLNNRLYSNYELSRKIVKNVFYNYITIPPIANETKKVIKNMNALNDADLQVLLAKTLSSYFRNFIKESRLSKASIETYYNELVVTLHKDFQTFKAKSKQDFTNKVSLIKKRLNEIDQVFSTQQAQITRIKTELDKNETIIRKERIAALEDNRKELDVVQQFLKERDQVIDKKMKPLALMNAEIIAINNDVQKLTVERQSLIEELNRHSLALANASDEQYAKKEKQIATLEIEKIGAYIFIRNSLVFLNRIIRDVKIELGLRKIQNRWTGILNNFSEIKKQSQQMMNEFKFFDSLLDIESKIDAIRDVEINNRIVDLETSEEVSGSI